MKKFASLTVAALLCVSSPAFAETLTNATVIALVNAGLGAETIAAKVRNATGDYDVSTDKLLELKRLGVADSIIAAMLDSSTKSQTAAATAFQNESIDPKVPHASGLYVLADWDSPSKMTRLDATTANQARTSGMFGAILTSGLAPLKVKTAIPNATSKLKVRTARPTCYFYFDSANPTAGIAGLYFSSIGSSVTSPNEFTVVKFQSKKGVREVTTGKASAFGGATYGLVDKDKISFTSSVISPGVFKVTIDNEMPKGEYAFVNSNGGGANAGAISRAFDFTIE